MWKWNDGTNYLMHHGILGQKWGIRRFQNKDGSYTRAGLERRRELLPDPKSLYGKRESEIKEVATKVALNDQDVQSKMSETLGYLDSLDKEVLRIFNTNSKEECLKMINENLHNGDDVELDDLVYMELWDTPETNAMIERFWASNNELSDAVSRAIDRYLGDFDYPVTKKTIKGNDDRIISRSRSDSYLKIDLMSRLMRYSVDLGIGNVYRESPFERIYEIASR